MNKVNHAEYKKNILDKGKFQYYTVSPYASTERHYQKVLIISDKVSEPTEYYYRKEKLALIIPYNADGVLPSIEPYVNEISYHAGVQASFFGVFGIESKTKVLCTFDN